MRSMNSGRRRPIVVALLATVTLLAAACAGSGGPAQTQATGTGEIAKDTSGTVRILNVMPMTPVMLAEYVPADFDIQQRLASEEALVIVARESGIDAARISWVVRQGGIYHEILEEAAHVKADLIVMTSHRPAMRTYFLGSNAGHVVRYAKC